MVVSHIADGKPYQSVLFGSYMDSGRLGARWHTRRDAHAIRDRDLCTVTDAINRMGCDELEL